MLSSTSSIQIHTYSASLCRMFRLKWRDNVSRCSNTVDFWSTLQREPTVTISENEGGGKKDYRQWNCLRRSIERRGKDEGVVWWIMPGRKCWKVSVQDLNEEALEVSATLRIQSVLQGYVVFLQIHVLYCLQVDLWVCNTAINTNAFLSLLLEHIRNGLFILPAVKP